MPAFGNRARMARESRGLSQAELAELAGVTQAAISNLEAGRSGVSCEKLVMIADALGVSTDWLLGRDEPRYDFTDEEIIAEFNPAVWETLSEPEKQARIEMVRRMRRSGKRLL